MSKTKVLHSIIPILLAGLTFLPASTAFGQMELRSSALFQDLSFAWSAPYNGQRIPELKLRTLENEEVSLKDHYGKPLVIIKAGYT